MSSRPPRHDETEPGRAARALTSLYPPAWRSRYAQEFTSLLADSGIGPREVADIVLAAGSAWLRPTRHLHHPTARMRVTISVTLVSWTVWAAGAVLFAKLRHDGALHLTDAATPAVALSYNAYVLAAGLSTAAIVAAGLPLAAAVLRQVPPTERRRAGALLAMPVVAVFGYVGLAAMAASFLHTADHTGLLVFAVPGVVATLACSAGPVLAVRRCRPNGPALTVGVVAGGCAVALMALATAAGLISELLRDRHNAESLTVYAVVTGAAIAVAATSSTRGLRAVHRSLRRADHAVG